MRSKIGRIAAGLAAVILICNSGFSFSEEIRYQAGGKRDPFIPINTVVVEATAEQTVNIEGIIYDRNGASVVVVDGEPYRSGEMIGDLKVGEIHSSHVIIEAKDGSRQEYWISESAEQLLSR